MQKLFTAALFCCILTASFGQTPGKITSYLLTQFNATRSDATKGNNPWGMGLGVQAFLNNKTKFRPIIEVSGDAYLEDDKVLRIDSAGSPLEGVRAMSNLLIGISFSATKNIYLSLMAGPCFINGQALMTVKPSFGWYFSESGKWTGQISYISVFNRGNKVKADFNSLSFSIGLKLF
jgi:hypothetical protein